MDEEEPAWRAELREKITEDLARVYGHRWTHATEARRELLRQAFASKVDAIMPHIEAAEQRGRQQALREAADLVGDNATCGCSVCRSRREVADLLRYKAEQS